MESPTNAGKQFDSVEAFEEWLSDQSSPASGPDSPGIGEKVGRVIKDTLERISPRSSSLRSSSPESPTEENVPLYLQGIELTKPREREAERLGISLDELNEVLAGDQRASCPITGIPSDRSVSERWAVESERSELFRACEDEFGLSDADAEIWRGVWAELDTENVGVLSLDQFATSWHQQFGDELQQGQLEAISPRSTSGGDVLTYYDFLKFISGNDEGLKIHNGH